MLRFRTRQPVEQAQRIGVVQRIEADGQVLLVSFLVGFQVVQRVALAPFLAADGLILPEDGYFANISGVQKCTLVISILIERFTRRPPDSCIP